MTTLLWLGIAGLWFLAFCMFHNARHKHRSKEISRETRACLELLLAEIYELNGDWEKIDRLLQSWIRANDLNPDRVTFVWTSTGVVGKARMEL